MAGSVRVSDAWSDGRLATFLLARSHRREYQGCMREGLRQLEARIVETASRIDSLTYQLLADLRRFDQEKGWRASGSISCVHWLTTQLGWDRVTASERVRVARRLAALPLTDAAFRAGELSYSKVRALARAATSESEASLLVHARGCTAAALEQLCRRSRIRRAPRRGPDPGGRRRVRRRSASDGTVQIEARFESADAEVVWEALRVVTDSAESPFADQVVALAREFLASRRAAMGTSSPSKTAAATPAPPEPEHTSKAPAAPRKPNGRPPTPTRLPARHATPRPGSRSARPAKVSVPSPRRPSPRAERASTTAEVRRGAIRDGP
jgi:hypothetical protein